MQDGMVDDDVLGQFFKIGLLLFICNWMAKYIESWCNAELVITRRIKA
jgi:hypothetical protein